MTGIYYCVALVVLALLRLKSFFTNESVTFCHAFIMELVGFLCYQIIMVRIIDNLSIVEMFADEGLNSDSKIKYENRYLRQYVRGKTNVGMRDCAQRKRS